MTNADWRSLVEDQQKRAKLHRKRGDALRRTGQLDQAMKEFRAGLSGGEQAGEKAEIHGLRTAQETRALAGGVEGGLFGAE